jgi:hypothetical protein
MPIKFSIYCVVIALLTSAATYNHYALLSFLSGAQTASKSAKQYHK